MRSRPAASKLKGICGAIAQWHKVDLETGEVGRNPVEVGKKGWSREGSLKRKGDSWVAFGEGESFKRKVSADAGQDAAPTSARSTPRCRVRSKSPSSSDAATSSDPAEQGARFGRRALLAAGLAGALALVVPVRLRRCSGAPALAAKPRAAGRFAAAADSPGADRPLRSRSRSSRRRSPSCRGKKTRMWTYGGSFPGPTIRRPAGEATEVTFVHKLPAKAGELTVHLHGGHNRTSERRPAGRAHGEPAARASTATSRASSRRRDSGNDLLIAPGAPAHLPYDLIEDGAPERGAFQWYHDHRLERTARNVWRGLAGMWIIDDELDASLPLPRGERDLAADDHRPLLRQAQPAHGPVRRLRLGARTTASRARCVLVNGVFLPYHRVSATRHRLRILNASNFRIYNLELSGGAAMVQIATESGLMPAPVKRKQVLVGPGERVELIVDFAGSRGQAGRAAQRQAPRRRRARLDRLRRLADASSGSASRAADDTSVPASLRPLPAWVAAAPPSPQPKLGVHDRQRLSPDLARQRQDLRPGALGRLPGARHDRDLGASQRDRGRPPDPPAPHRLVHALAKRQAPAALGAVPEGDLLPRSGRPRRRRRATSATTPAST